MWERRRERVLGRPVWLALPVVVAVAGLSAPVFYLVTGSWREFVDGFWTYAEDPWCSYQPGTFPYLADLAAMGLRPAT